MQSFTLRELAEIVAGTIEGDEGLRVSGLAAVDDAGPEDLTFVTTRAWERRLASSRSGAALIPEDMEPGSGSTSFIRVRDPRQAFGKLLPLFHPSPPAPGGVGKGAVIGDGVCLGEGVTIAPYVCLGDRTRIGIRSRIGPFTIIEADVEIGDDCWIEGSCTLLAGARLGNRVRLHPGVRIGTEGFGYSSGPAGHTRIPQVGGCIIGDDVEIGANCTIDRGAIGNTLIGRGTKIDNLVHVGHNVHVGEDCVLVAQVGLAGSAHIGDDVQLGGQAGVAGHLTIGPGARIAARAGVIGNVPAGATYSGYPARPHHRSLRASAAALRLPGFLRRLRALERRLEARDE